MDKARQFTARAEEVVVAIRAAFGVPGSTTGLAMSLMFDLCEQSERKEVASRLVSLVRENRHRVDYGTIGSGCVLRALFENGYADDAYLVMVQKEYPGYGYFAADGELTTFPESWSIDWQSRNHGAFADVVACMFRYLAGIRHVSECPGRNYIEIVPCFPKGLADFSATHDGYSVAWRRNDGKVICRVTIPAGKSARYRSKSGEWHELVSGVWTFIESERN